MSFFLTIVGLITKNIIKVDQYLNFNKYTLGSLRKIPFNSKLKGFYNFPYFWQGEIQSTHLDFCIVKVSMPIVLLYATYM